MKSHKHAALIKAWADGAEIEYFNTDAEKWLGIMLNPAWDEYTEYRIKPEPKPDVVFYGEIYKSIECGYCFFGKVKNVPSNNLKLTLSGETGELIKAEVIK